VEGLREGVSDALALVPRLGAVVGRVEELVGRVSTLVDRAGTVLDRADAALTGMEATRARADEIVDRAGATAEKADDAIERVGTTQQKADEAIERVGATQQKADDAIERVGATQQKADEAITAVDRTTTRAGETLTRAGGLVDGMEPLAGDYAEPLRRLAPSIQRLAETLDPDEVEALVRLVDRLPDIVARLEDSVLPALADMGNVGQDVHDLLDTMQDLRQVVKGFPGSRLFRRRGAEATAQVEGPEAPLA
jgi:ABC-type transporter Mla subunit MlaD